MKSDLFTSIVVFIVGIIIAFITCNMLLPSIEDFVIKTVNIDSSASLSEPNPEIFNYRAINPTVEVYVGNGSEQNSQNSSDQNESDQNNLEENENGTTN